MTIDREELAGGDVVMIGRESADGGLDLADSGGVPRRAVPVVVDRLVTPDREARREAVRSGDRDRWPHPGGCWCRECAREEAGD